MGLFGTILSVIPTVASVVGKLFGGKENDYLRFSLYADTPKMPLLNGNVFFEKKNGRILFHNNCDYPVHLSMEKKNQVETPVNNDIILPYMSQADVTDMLSEYAAKNVGRMRISINKPPHGNENQVMAMNCKGRLNRSIQTPIQIGEYISAELKGNDLSIIAHTGCTIVEICSLHIKGEGNETENCYENITPGEELNGINGMIKAMREESTTIMTFANAIAPYEYSDIIDIDINLLCKVNGVKQTLPTDKEREKCLSGSEWEFLRIGRCLN